MLKREDGASDGIALVAERLGGPPEPEHACRHAERSDGVLDVAGELPRGVRVPWGRRVTAALAAAAAAALPTACLRRVSSSATEWKSTVGLDLPHVGD